MSVTFGARDTTGNFTGTTQALPSQVWTNGLLYVVDVFQKVSSGSPAVPTSIAGATMTFVRVTSCESLGTISAVNDSRWSTYVAIGNGNTEVVTITVGAALNEGSYCVFHCPGSKTTNGGLDAIRQGVPVSGGGANPSATLAALQDAGSLVVGMFAKGGGNFTPGAGFTQISNPGVLINEFDEYKSNATLVDTTATAANWIGTAYEIAAPSSPATHFGPYAGKIVVVADIVDEWTSSGGRQSIASGIAPSIAPSIGGR